MGSGIRSLPIPPRSRIRSCAREVGQPAPERRTSGALIGSKVFRTARKTSKHKKPVTLLSAKVYPAPAKASALIVKDDHPELLAVAQLFLVAEIKRGITDERGQSPIASYGIFLLMEYSFSPMHLD
jgi:hypothetical protein